MSCKSCASNNLRGFKSEMTIAFREYENLNRDPVYFSQDVSVCLDCGHLELVLPPCEITPAQQEPLDPKSRSRSAKTG